MLSATSTTVSSPRSFPYQYGYTACVNAPIMSAITAGTRNDAPSPRRAVTRPKITGTAKVGKKLTASRGTWSLTGLSYSYRWLRDGKEITGATKSTYVLTKSDAGKKISVRVTARKKGYEKARRSSKQVKIRR